MKQPMGAAALAQNSAPNQPAHTAHTARQGRVVALALLVVGLVLALLSVLFIPLLVTGTEPASSRVSRAASMVALPEGVSYGSVEEAAAALGFTPRLPVAPEGFALRAARVLDGAALELVYQKDAATVTYRTAEGNGDLSYDTTEYHFATLEEADGVARSYAGPSETEWKLAQWAAGGYTYALVAQTPLDPDILRAFAESVA